MIIISFDTINLSGLIAIHKITKYKKERKLSMCVSTDIALSWVFKAMLF